MGCWNGTDLITQLPIMCGDEVALILIKKSKYHFNADNSCYSNEYFKPLPILLYGKYDDYGCIENISGDIEQFKEIIQRESDMDNEEILSKMQKDFGEDYSIVNIESYVRFVERNKISDIGYVLIHKKLFNSLKSYDDYIYGKDKYLQDYYKAITFEKTIAKAKDDGLSDMDIFELRINCPVIHWGVFDKISLDDVNIDSISAIMSINSVLGVTRKMWFPQTGAGGQVQIEEPHRIINNFYTNYLIDYDMKDFDD